MLIETKIVKESKMKLKYCAPNPNPKVRMDDCSFMSAPNYKRKLSRSDIENFERSFKNFKKGVAIALKLAIKRYRPRVTIENISDMMIPSNRPDRFIKFIKPCLRLAIRELGMEDLDMSFHVPKPEFSHDPFTYWDIVLWVN